MLSISVLWLSHAGGAACLFFTQVLIARTLGPSNFGAFSAALAAVMIIAPLAGFGVSGYLLRVFGVEGWRATRWIPACVRFALKTTLVAIAILSLWFAFGLSDSGARELLPFLIPHLVAVMVLELSIAKFQLEERFVSLAMWQFVPHLARLVLVFIGISLFASQGGIRLAGAAYALVALGICVAGTHTLRALYAGEIKLVGHAKPMGKSHTTAKQNQLAHSTSQVLKELWPFGLTGVLYLVLLQSPVVLVERIAGEASAGIFAAAFSLLTAIYILPMVLYQKFLFPKLHRWAEHDHKTFHRIYKIGNRAMIVAGAATGLLLYAATPVLISIIFGPEFHRSSQVLQILALCVPIKFLSSSVGAILVTKDNMRRKVWLMGLAAASSISASLLLVPIWSVTGAAFAVIVGEIVLLFTMLYVARRFVLPGIRTW
jgi:O-antigen/teichoic acid export membrane protein